MFRKILESIRRTTHNASGTTHNALGTMHPAPGTMHPAPGTMHNAPGTLFLAFAALAMLAGVAVAQQKPKPVRVDLTSEPEGANVILDGTMRGTAPLTLFDVEPGEHHVRYELANYEPKDDFFSLADGGYVVRSAVLEPVKGLLLITTEPEGCSVSLDGLSFGTTPRLITSLDAKGLYRFQLQKTGYQPKTLEVRFSGRTPIVRHETLILDSGVLNVTSTPTGAQVMLNGIVRGVTPLSVSDIPKGRATLTISLDGYLPQTRELSLNAGDSQNVDVTLEGKPGSLFLSSVPDGARFYVNDTAQGKGPVTLSNLAPGNYSVRAEMDGYGSVTRDVTIPLGKMVSEEFRLENIRGRLEIKTSPAGAQVLIDGRTIGSTKDSGAASDLSDIFSIENLDAGEHTLTVRKDGYGEVVKHPVIENSRTKQMVVRMKRVFKPNVRIVTATGTYTGVFVDNTMETITIEVSMGITRSFPREDIREMEFLK